MLEITVHKDSNGYAIDLHDSRFELTSEGFEAFIDECQSLIREQLDGPSGTVCREIMLDVEDDEDEE